MSDATPNANEPRGHQFNDINVQGSVNIKLPEIDTAAASVGLLVTNLNALKNILQNYNSMSGSSLNSLLRTINTQAQAAARSVATLTGAATAGGTGSTSTTYTPAPTAGTPAAGATAWTQQATQQATNAVATRMPGGIAAASQYLKGTDSLMGGMVMGGMRFLRDRIATSRNLSIQTGSELGMLARQQGTGVENLMNQIAQQPGNVMGTSRDMLDLFRNAPQLGASFDFRGNDQTSGRQGPRAAGFLKGVSEAQLLNPGESVGNIVSQIGGFTSNVGAQQTGAFMTGGAFSMIAAGGRQKSISEWAESILKWFEGLRAAPNKGKPFNYGDLMAQYFPGSNIDAWFQMNGVTQDMRNYWWTYALEKANKTGDTGGAAMEIGADTSNVAYQRLRSTTELTRTEFNLGGQMMGAFVNKEQSNRWFNQVLGMLQTNLIPAFANTIGKFVEFLPDTLEDIMFAGIEGIAAGDMSGDTTLGGTGDIGDAGGYSSTGGTGMAGLSLNMRSKLGPMMRANPRLRVNSGLRDNAMQKRLKDQGYSRVSGKPSAHTRGDAADLGPSTEYGWIMKNANRFGLKSGKGQGEPWHVGVGDMGDAFDTFKDWFGGMTGSADSIVDLLKRIFGGLFDKLGIGSFDSTTPPATRPVDASNGENFYQQLLGASKNGITIGGANAGLPPNLAPERGGITGGPGGGGGAGGSWSDDTTRPTDTTRMGSSYSDFFQQVLRGMGASISSANLTKLGALGKFEGGGGTFNPFNSTGGDFPNKFNSVGVENYPNWDTGVQYTVKLLSQDRTAAMRANLLQGGSYADWRNAVTGFYHSWGGPSMPNISESNANAFLTRPPPGAVGDMSEYSTAAMSIPSQPDSKTPIQFHNTFHIDGGGGGGGIDVRRMVVRAADLLEDEMNKRLARSN